MSTNPFRYDGRMNKLPYAPVRNVAATYCNLCGHDFIDGDDVVGSGWGYAHDCCGRHAEAAEAVGQSGYPGCKDHQ